MKPARVRLAARIAAIEAFREDAQRQALAVARHAATAAQASLVNAEGAWRAVEEQRAVALAVNHDLARYVLWGDLASHACAVHGQVTVRVETAEVAATSAAKQWADARVRADATEERAERVAREDAAATEARVFGDAMDLWLSRARHTA